MTTRSLWITVTVVTATLLTIGLWGGWSGAVPGGRAMQLYAQDTDQSDGIALEFTATSTSISYQGRLTSPEGETVQGTRAMRFQVFDVANDGTALWDSGSDNVSVNSGLFNVTLDIDPTLFDGRSLWLQIDINDQVLTPRRPLLAVPYALGLLPGAMVAGAPHESSGQTFGATLTDIFPDGKALAGYAPATGTALHAQAGGGQGLAASSEQNYGVSGSSTEGSGGSFTSDEGYGVVATTAGTYHWDHAGYFQAEAGYGLLAESTGNMAIRGQAGDMTGLWQPVGAVGVVGLGASRGLYGSGGSSYGIYGTSLNWYGIYGWTSRSDNNYGLYTPDNLFSSNVTTSGATLMVVENGSGETLQPGDVVAAGGVSTLRIASGNPLLQVAKANQENSHAVAGVVHSKYNMDALAEDFDPTEGVELTSSGPIQPGDVMLIVTHGITPVNVDAGSVAVESGDALVVGSTGGIAVSMDEMAVTSNGLPLAAIGTALEPATGEQRQIQVFVSAR